MESGVETKDGLGIGNTKVRCAWRRRVCGGLLERPALYCAGLWLSTFSGETVPWAREVVVMEQWTIDIQFSGDQVSESICEAFRIRQHSQYSNARGIPGFGERIHFNIKMHYAKTSKSARLQYCDPTRYTVVSQIESRHKIVD